MIGQRYIHYFSPVRFKKNRSLPNDRQAMMKEQGEGLEMLGQSADRLSQISMGIHEELGHQNK